ncbi:GAF domain-containing protein [Fulvivirga sedimenti]|uniref:GAF domain-containing protein n=1 Tax=Fulvivirga sedimenti TaxID=2879465 RepID=A0A9X1HU46_9BACT|nr:GAF domain-containing protein [Fulvivirga sedimenti]MCA6077991.1 GAF domain-containing protein [Fulvivirga sedimenti]
MKRGNFNGIIFTIIFVIGILISGYLLIQLKSDLALTSGVLSTTEIELAMPYFIRLQIAVFGTFLVGLLGFYFMQRHHQHELIYVDRNRQEKRSQEDKEHKEADNRADDASFIDEILKKEKNKPLEKAFHALCEHHEAIAGALYQVNGKKNSPQFELTVPFALSFSESERPVYEFGEGFIGQTAKEKRAMFIDNIPENTHRGISGLGQAPPKFLSVVPLIHEDDVVGVCELGTYKVLNEGERKNLTIECETIAGYLKKGNGIKQEKTPKS